MTEKNKPGGEQSNTQTTTSKRSSVRARYTGVVYIHGIGSQRRYEETSRLIDSLDKYRFYAKQNGNPVGDLQGIEPSVEPLRLANKKGTIGYIGANFSGSSAGKRSNRVRFYEVYWAPIMADVASPLGVIKWAFGQVTRPFTTGLSPWRERQRLRRSTLHALVKSDEPADVGDANDLLKLYDSFEGLQAQRDHPWGLFMQFRSFLKEEVKNDEKETRLLALANRWVRAYRLEEIRNAIVLWTIALLLILVSLGLVQLGMALLKPLSTETWLAPLFTDVELNFKTVGAAVVSGLGFLGLGKLLADYLGDVQAWSTYTETDSKNIARNKVLDNCIETLTHVLNDENCERVVIVSHSLGTSIANDALLAMARINRAHNASGAMSAKVPLDKIDQFVTFGSPVDKIEYFFESFTSESHRYKRVKDTLRGDINSEPFSSSDIPQIHWVNFWDDGDPISGPLQSPAGEKRMLQQINDVHVATYLFPSPGASHSGYFENKSVIEPLFKMIFHADHSYLPLRTQTPKSLDLYRKQDVVSDQKPGKRLILLIMALLIPWLTLASLIGWVIDHQMLFLGSAYTAGAFAVVLILVQIVSLLWGSLRPLESP